MDAPIPLIDLFAGPGGLGEGFAAYVDPATSKHPFRLALSVEKDPIAHRTLQLRALFRSFAKPAVPDLYYDYVCGRVTREQLFLDSRYSSEVEKARHEAVCAELGDSPEAELDVRIRRALGGATDWVLIGGPPCQAYSLVGRSRVRGVDPDKYKNDPRHLLYKEYLRVLRTHGPALFVMENVKGMLSSMHGGRLIFDHIIEDLSRPADDLHYEIRSFVLPRSGGDHKPTDYVIKSEYFSVPQARHRVILLGVRSDLASHVHSSLVPAEKVKVREVLKGLPPIRGRLSKEPDSHESWLAALDDTRRQLVGWRHPDRVEVVERMDRALTKAAQIRATGGACFAKPTSNQLRAELSEWFLDDRLAGVIQHESRAHMRTDLQRYFFASTFAGVIGSSPKLQELPARLQPEHANAANDDVPFADRFRVQVWQNPSSTVVSHIAKDGHYFIHPDPAQCRSLTVREAARLQSFPDNYFFEGNRTEQFTQVGNAVPPFLARQLAHVVYQLFREGTCT